LPDSYELQQYIVCVRDDMGMEFSVGMGIPWKWELMTKLGMGMGRNEKQPAWEWEWPLFPWEQIPIRG